jgi:hypothetical protein
VLLDVFGRRVRIEAGGHPSAAQVDALWSRCRATDVGPVDSRAHGAAYGDETVIALPRTDRPLSPEAGLRLGDQLRELAIAAAADRLMVLSSAAVATPGGAVLGLVSADPAIRAGAAAELSRRGFGYVTDELLATDESFDVVAFPEPLRFEQDPQTGTGSSTLAGPDALGMRSCPDGRLHLAAAVLLEHDPGHRGTPELTRVRRPDDVRRLEGALVSAPPAWSATALPDLIDEVDGLWVLRYGEIHAAAPVLAELLLARTQQPVRPGQLYVAVGIGDSDDRPTAVSGHHLALDGLRRVVWMAAAGGASIEDLHAAANRELAGKTAISVQLVASAVRDLMALGLLVPEESAGRLTLVEGAPVNHSANRG